MITFNEGIEKKIYDGNNQIKVIWEDTLDNHSKAKERQIEKYFQNKYKTMRVKVIFKPITSKTTDIVIDSQADASEIVLDATYQRALIDRYVTDNKILVNMDQLMRLDTSVNVELEDYKDLTNRYKTFKIKEISFSNFMSYGQDNKIVYDKNIGITSVLSSPPNYGGKTILTVDLLLFLFFGSTTKTKNLEDIFNLYTGEDLVEVKGVIEIEGESYLINRSITRKRGRDGTFTCKSSVDFFQVLPRGGVRQLNGEQRKYTDELIKTYVGSYDDFLITILTTGDNLDDLIRTKPTERGRILTRFIGLEYFREKEQIAKKKYSDWKEKAKLQRNNTQDINAEIRVEEDKIQSSNMMILTLTEEEARQAKNIAALESEKESLFRQRYNDINTELYKFDELTFIDGITKINNDIKIKEELLTKTKSDIPEPEKQYDVDYYGRLKSLLKTETEESLINRFSIEGTLKLISNLTDSEICQTCKRPLEGVDHQHEIVTNKTKLEVLYLEKERIALEITKLDAEIKQVETLKSAWDNYDKNLLIVDKLQAELSALRDRLKNGEAKLSEYRAGKEKVAKNQQIDTDLSVLGTKISTAQSEKNLTSLQINNYLNNIQTSQTKITGYKDLLVELKKEEVVDSIFKAYLNIYGKNGISKMVLSTMIPIINSHLALLLSDSAEFSLELRMDEKTEVEFWMIDDETGVEKAVHAGSGYEKTISSLALRCVLSKVCSLPKPNIIIFDEISGKVANDNLDKIGLFFDKLRQFFDNIWLISHNPLIQDWADNIVRVEKINNISTIKFN